MATNYTVAGALLACILLTAGCGSGSSQAGSAPELMTNEGSIPQAIASLPVDGRQPWEQLDANGHVIPAERSAASINANTDFTAGVERFLDSGDIAGNGDALRLNGTDSSGSSYAMYRVSLQAEQPGVVSVDANLLSAGSQYYVGVSNYGTGHWDWRGPFSDNHVRLPVVTDDNGNYTSALGNTFISVLVSVGSSLDIVGVGINQFELADAVAPATPLGLSLTAVNGGLELNWSPVLVNDLAGYRIYYSGKSFVNPDSAGVQSVPYLEGSTQHMLAGLKTTTFVTVAAVDFAGNESALSSLESASPLLAAPGSISLTGSAASGGINEAIMLSASGADLYDWDLDGDGVFEIADDAIGNQAADTSATGLIRPRVRGRDTSGERVALGGLSLLVSGNTRPVASATADPQSGPAPLDVTFTGIAEDNEDEASALTYAWDFDGDGIYETGTDTLTPAVQNYAAAGLFAAKFRVTDSNGSWDVDTVPVQVSGNAAPIASLQVNKSRSPAPFTATFFAADSKDPDGSITGYEWDFDGDGIYEVDSGMQSSQAHTFEQPGDYTVALRVTDDKGAQSGATISIVSQGWIVHTLDQGGGTAQTLSMAQINGNPAIAWYRQNSGDLRYVRSVTPLGRDLADWSGIVEVDVSGNTGASSSLLEVAGNPAISYTNIDSTNLRYIRSTSGTGASASDWSEMVIVNATIGSGSGTDMKIISGNPAIVHHNNSDNKIWFSRSATPTGTSAADWSQQFAVSGAFNSTPTARLIVAAGNPAVFYRETDGNTLRYVRSATATGSQQADWNVDVEVDGNGNTGFNASALIVDGHPAVSYWSSTDGYLHYSRSLSNTGASASDWDDGVIVDSTTDNLGQHASMALINGRPAISYLEVNQFELRFAHSIQAHGNASGYWNLSTADSDGKVGYFSSMIETEGHAAIAYRDSLNDSLKYALLFD